VIYSATCFLGLNQHNYLDNGSNLLDLVFSNCADFSIYLAEYGIVQTDRFHLLLIVDCIVSIKRATVGRSNAAVTQAIDLAVPSGHSKKHEYLPWISGKLILHSKKKYFYIRFKKFKTG
jgi:hypothetical protein